MRWTAKTIHEHNQRVAYEEGIREKQIRIQVEHDADIYHDAYVAAKAGADAELDAIDERKRR